MPKNLVVGCGLTGAVLAERIATQTGQDVLVIDKRDHIGGNIYDYKDDDTNITIHKYGPHVFHTKHKPIWDYLSRFTKWHYFNLEVKGFVQGKYLPIPFNLNSLHTIYPKYLADKLEIILLKNYKFGEKIYISDLINTKDNLIKFLTNFIVDHIFYGYSQKQWDITSLENIDRSILDRIPLKLSFDDRYFEDQYQGIPKEGYTIMIQKILDHNNIQVELKTDYKYIKDKIDCDNIFYTGMIDEFYDYQYGALPYRSLDFDIVKYSYLDYFQKYPHINYPNNYDFTRSIEYSYYLPGIYKGTCVVYEYPKKFINNINEPYYPIPSKLNNEIYNKYRAIDSKNLYFSGRLGNYKYYNMDDAIMEAFNTFDIFLANNNI